MVDVRKAVSPTAARGRVRRRRRLLRAGAAIGALAMSSAATAVSGASTTDVSTTATTAAPSTSTTTLVPTTTTIAPTTTGAAGATSEPLRFTIESAVDCSGPSITFSYDDHVDGHVPQAVHEEFDETGYIRWTADEVHQVNGDYFNERTFPMEGQSLSRAELYGYLVVITYDDGVQQADIDLVELAAVCPATSPSTSPATTGAPATTAGAVESTEAPVASTEGHPLVGAWMLVDISDPEGVPFLAAFSSDGIYQQVDSDGAGYGAWEPTGPSSAALTFVTQFVDDEGGDAGSTTIRASIEVNPDGLGFTAEYTIELGGEGSPPGEYGPGSVTGTRIVVEPMGTPVGSLEDLLAGFPEGTEAAPPTTTAS